MFFSICQTYNQAYIGLSKHIRWPNPPGDPTGTDPKPADPTYSGGQQRIFSTKNQLRQVGFGFSPPKTRTDLRKTHNPAKTQILVRKFQISAIKTQILTIKNPDLGAISRRSNKILMESSEISSNPVRLKPDLTKSHRFWWDFRQIWVFLTFSRSFLAFFFFAVFSDLWRRPTRPSTHWSMIRPTRLLRRSAASEFSQNSILSGRFRVGHKLDLDRPMDSPKHIFAFLVTFVYFNLSQCLFRL